MDLNTTCKEYDLCTPETRAELTANGFDFSVCKFGITEFIAGRMKMGFIVETNGAIPYPTFSEIVNLIMGLEIEHNKNTYYFAIYGFSVGFHDENDDVLLHKKIGEAVEYFSNGKTEACCNLWLKLKKGGFLNG